VRTASTRSVIWLLLHRGLRRRRQDARSGSAILSVSSGHGLRVRPCTPLVAIHRWLCPSRVLPPAPPRLGLVGCRRRAPGSQRRTCPSTTSSAVEIPALCVPVLRARGDAHQAQFRPNGGKPPAGAHKPTTPTARPTTVSIAVLAAPGAGTPGPPGSGPGIVNALAQAAALLVRQDYHRPHCSDGSAEPPGATTSAKSSRERPFTTAWLCSPTTRDVIELRHCENAQLRLRSRARRTAKWPATAAAVPRSI
jgi:hypothetical protein